MFSGAQISLYPMSDDFIGIILGAIKALDPYRPQFRIETDDISTLIVGPPEQLFPAMRDLFVAAAQSGTHCVLSAAVSRGCPGEPDDPHLHAARRHGRSTVPLVGAHPGGAAGRCRGARDRPDHRGAVLALSAGRRPPYGRDLWLHRLS